MNLVDYLNKAMKPRHDEDAVDRLNNRIIVYLFLAMGLSIFAQEYYGHPMKCWQKPQWQDSWLQYAENLCFIEGTYFMNMTNPYPRNHGFEFSEFGKKVNFYQWIPLIFHLMGAIMLLPRYYWDFINWTSFLHMKLIIELAEKGKMKKIGIDKKELKACVNHMVDAFSRRETVTAKVHKDERRDEGQHNIFSVVGKAKNWWLKRYSTPSYLYYAYLSFKFLNIFTVFVLVVILNTLVGDEENSMFGFKMFSDIVIGVNWRETGNFPRVTTCAFKIREVGNGSVDVINNEVTHCVLSTQMIIEKFYVIVWICLFVLQVLNIYSLSFWIHTIFSNNMNRYLKNVLESAVVFLYPKAQDDPKIMEKMKHGAAEEDKLKKVYEEAMQKKEPLQKVLDAYNKYQECIDKNINTIKKIETKREKNREYYDEYLKTHYDDFVRFVGKDGLFVFRMLHDNTGDQVAGTIATNVFMKYVLKIRKHVLSNHMGSRHRIDSEIGGTNTKKDGVQGCEPRFDSHYYDVPNRDGPQQTFTPDFRNVNYRAHYFTPL